MENAINTVICVAGCDVAIKPDFVFTVDSSEREKYIASVRPLRYGDGKYVKNLRIILNNPWVPFVSSTPADHRFIDDEERAFLAESAPKGSVKAPRLRDFPWRAVFLSVPVWATFVSTVTYTWSLYVLLTGLPTYFGTVLGFDLQSNGIVSALPYLLLAIIQMLAGQIADSLRVRLHLTTTLVRKIMDVTGHLVPGILIAVVGYSGCDSRAAVTLLILSIGITGLCSAGCLINFLDLCPKYAGIVFGISNTLGTVSGIIGPIVTGTVTKGNPSIYSWRVVFLIAAGLYFLSSVTYSFFGDAKVQSWAMDDVEKSNE
ncbi:unnamed protein product, partial [Soboliphyme baturini]|uniref:MFS domain-containing protein n=1 Tax=Soboliphyme baturini TaxID=241478 RepID=A0A183IZ37_9BILA